MEKLLNLLNEYKQGKPFQFTGYDEEYGMFDTNLNMDGNTSLPAETIVCKKFGFIHWLVENDKTLPINPLYGYSKTDRVIITLSVKDDPISFLISLLK